MLKSKKLLFINCLVILFMALTCNMAYASGSVFEDLSGRTTEYAVGLRNFAYVISGFGIIMFTFLAICGKINFKHLGYIVICLFFLSATGALIDYIFDEDGLYVVPKMETKFGSQYKKAVRNSSL